MIEQIGAGIIAGAAYGILGWQKEVVKKKGTKVDWKKLAKTIVICGVVGGITAYSGADFNIAITGGLGIGVTKVVSLVLRIGKSWLAKY